jgi:hypothetical protein
MLQPVAFPEQETYPSCSGNNSRVGIVRDNRALRVTLLETYQANPCYIYTEGKDQFKLVSPFIFKLQYVVYWRGLNEF